MRQIVLDTETTGLQWGNGDRVIEIGCVELLHRKLSGKHFHVYINPERTIDAGAVAVHGITNDFLADKPRFREIAADFEAFVQGAELIIHNASFDLGFLNMEFALLGRPPIDTLCPSVIDTLRLAKSQHPGKKASLDALCERYEVANAHRTLHGALLDAELLADVYLAMTRGQESLAMALDEIAPGTDEGGGWSTGHAQLQVLRATPAELAVHEAYLRKMGKARWVPPPTEGGA